MKVTGYLLMAAIKEAEIARKQMINQWEDSLYCFPGETKLTPDEASDQLRKQEELIVRLQASQDWYNSKVVFKHPFEEGLISLSMLIKMRGAFKRIASRWEKACEYDPLKGRLVRSTKDEEYARSRVDAKKALAVSLDINRKCEKIRVLMNRLNASEMDVPYLREGDVVAEDIGGV